MLCQDAPMQELRLRPVTAEEYESFRVRLVRDFTAEHVSAGNGSADEAERRAAAQVIALLPHGPSTAGHLLLTAEDALGEPVGFIWLAPHYRAGTAWIYDIEVHPEHRGKGYGRALLQAAEDETRRLGVNAIGLNVFGATSVGLAVYESAGYAVMSLQMRKELGSA
jgi:GNAT superfamily N-acetyltransferase